MVESPPIIDRRLSRYKRQPSPCRQDRCQAALSHPTSYNEMVEQHRWRNGMVTPTASVADNNAVGWRFDNTYSLLPGVLFAPARPATMRAPRVAILNHRLANEL